MRSAISGHDCFFQVYRTHSYPFPIIKYKVSRMERSLARNMLNNRSEYEHYEDDLNAYRSRSKSKLQEWSLLECQYFTKTAE